MWEHGLDISENVVNVLSGGLLNGSTNRPDKAEDEPFLDVEELLDLVLIFGGFEVKKLAAEGIEQLAKVSNTSSLTCLAKLFALSLFDLEDLWNVFLNESLQEVLDLLSGLLTLGLLLFDPFSHVWLPAKFIEVHEDHTSS